MAKNQKSIAEYVSFIQANIDKYTVKQMCSALKFPRSTYCVALKHVSSKRKQEYMEFSNEVLSVYNEFKNDTEQLRYIENLMIEISHAQ